MTSQLVINLFYCFSFLCAVIKSWLVYPVSLFLHNCSIKSKINDFLVTFTSIYFLFEISRFCYEGLLINANVVKGNVVLSWNVFNNLDFMASTNNFDLTTKNDLSTNAYWPVLMNTFLSSWRLKSCLLFKYNFPKFVVSSTCNSIIQICMVLRKVHGDVSHPILSALFAWVRTRKRFGAYKHNSRLYCNLMLLH